MRTSLLLLLASLSLCQTAWSQKENWTFSDRTGIKGVQLSVGGYVLAKPQQLRESLQPYILKQASDTAKLIHSPFDKRDTKFRLEVVYAPFRFKSNPWLKNIEVFAGFSYQGDATYAVEVRNGGEISPTEGLYSKHKFYASHYFSGLHAAISVNKNLGSHVMIYGRVGLGLGIGGGVKLESFDQEFTYYQDDTAAGIFTSNRYRVPNSEVYYASRKSWNQEASIGLKMYISCRVNLFVEYGIDNQIFKNETGIKYSSFSQGYQIGIRYKFNPPEALTPEEEKKKEDAFW